MTTATETFLHEGGSAGPVLSAMFSSPVVGVALLDERMRFRALNAALAGMNGVPLEKHFGKKVRHILGSATAKVEWAVEKVLKTGEPVPHVQLNAKLPARPDVGQWVESYFPVYKDADKVSRVAVLVLEVTGQRAFRSSLDRLGLNLQQLRAVLQEETESRAAATYDRQARDLFHRALSLVDHCISEFEGLTSTTDSLVDSGERKEVRDVAFRSNVNLSNREYQVVRMVAEAKSNKQIADELGISVRTAEAHRAHLMMKLGVHSVVELIRYAVRHHIVDA